MQSAAGSLEASSNLVSKVYFPRLVVPGAYVFASCVDFGFALIVLLVVTAAAGGLGLLPPLLMAVPLLLVVQLAAALGLGSALAALNAQYRDVKYVVPFALQLGMLATVLIAPDAWPAEARWIWALNPMAGVVATYRSLACGQAMDGLLLAQSSVSALFLLIGGVAWFSHRERRLVDLL